MLQGDEASSGAWRKRVGSRGHQEVRKEQIETEGDVGR
jgi:hypothetical protein